MQSSYTCFVLYLDFVENINGFERLEKVGLKNYMKGNNILSFLKELKHLKLNPKSNDKRNNMMLKKIKEIGYARVIFMQIGFA